MKQKYFSLLIQSCRLDTVNHSADEMIHIYCVDVQIDVIGPFVDAFMRENKVSEMSMTNSESRVKIELNLPSKVLV